MLSFLYRFHGHGSLRFVYSKGQVVRSKYFILKYSPNPRRTVPRVAVVVSKKIMKPAVGRNRIRRRLYETIRQELPQLNERTDIVLIVVSPEVMTASSEEINHSVTSALKQANLYKSAEK